MLCGWFFSPLLYSSLGGVHEIISGFILLLCLFDCEQVASSGRAGRSQVHFIIRSVVENRRQMVELWFRLVEMCANTFEKVRDSENQ